VSPLPVDLGGGALLRRLALEDLGAIWEVVEAERERLRVWLPWVDLTKTVGDQRTWLAGVIADERNLEGNGVFVDGAYAGTIGLRVDEFGVVGEIGYWISAAYEGRGLVTRATRAMIDLGFRELRLHRIAILAAVGNTRSRVVPERLGFTQEGVLRGAERGPGVFYDLVMYGLLEDEWGS
jgi:ribosomal-protein-serine acetyltransferase